MADVVDVRSLTYGEYRALRVLASLEEIYRPPPGKPSATELVAAYEAMHGRSSRR